MRKIFFLFICTLSTLAYTQTVRFTYETGYGIYGLDKLKDYQNSLSGQINNIPIKVITQFPDYFNHSVSLGFYLDNNVVFGFNAAYLSTGGRNHIRDYSGEYKLDMLLNA